MIVNLIDKKSESRLKQMIEFYFIIQNLFDDKFSKLNNDYIYKQIRNLIFYKNKGLLQRQFRILM